MSIAAARPEQVVRLDHVPWQTYVSLSDQLDGRRSRMVYDHGVLEIMSPGFRHELEASLIAMMIEAWADVKELDFLPTRSMTFRSQDKQRGFEADASYYLANSSLVAGRDEIDLSACPPPDLVIEIDVTRSSVDKLAVYNDLSIPEV